jgi:ATP-binding cassette subfamily B protein
MPLIEKLPAGLDAALAAAGERERLVAGVPTDMGVTGRFDEEWLVLTPERLRVYEGNGTGFRARVDLPVADVTSASAEALVGGGALIATLAGEPVEVLRYSNARQGKFNRIAKYLNDVAAYRAKIENPGPPAGGTEAQEPPLPPQLDADTEVERRCPRCNLVLPEDTKVCPACLNKRKVLARVLAYIRPYWKQAAAVWVLMLAGTALSLVPPYLVRPLTDRVLAPTVVASVADRRTLLGWLVLGLAGAQLVGLAVNVVRGRMMVRIATHLTHDLRLELYTHLQFLSLKFFDKRQTGSMIARVMRDTQSLEAVLMDGLQFFLANILAMIGIGAVLFYMNWRLALWVLVPMPVVFLLSHLFWKHLMTKWQRAGHVHSRLSAHVGDSLAGVRVVKAFAKEAMEIARFRDRSGDVRRADTDAEQSWTTLFPILWFITSTGSLSVWYVGGSRVIADSAAGLAPGRAFTLGTLMAFFSFLSMFYGPLQFLSRITDYLARALASAERVFEILDSEADVKDAADAVALPRLEGRVEFRDVTFGYDKHKPVLKNVSFEARPGQMIGLVGQSGAGKSTSINLICRFYEANEGSILIDGVDIRKIRQQDLRSQIGVVLQEPFLFSGSIRDNIGFSKPGAGLEEIMAAAKAANAHDFIVRKSDGYDTEVGERGQSLSGGERQRVAIARAILHDPRVLILDEATASVDTETEKQIQDAIARLVKGRTTFAIAHRLSTLRYADRLLVLKDGKLAESGTHAELLEKKGEFHRLVEMQQKLSAIIAVTG